jgi:Protein of unknown function (DUF3144)
MALETDKPFFDLSNSFIKLANEQASVMSPDRVSAALMHAAARFSAHLAVSAAPNLDETAEAAALKRLTTRFEEMFRENIEDHLSQRRQGNASGS